MLYNTCYITFAEIAAELLYNIQIWLYNIQDGYITHPNFPDVAAESLAQV